MKHYISIIAAVLMSLCVSEAQERIGGVIELDRTIHNFGDIMLSDGPVSCTFTVSNVSDQPIAIYNVVSTCGCTNVKWTKEPIQPKKQGKVSVTYSNDEGAYPFDKTLTMYVSGIKKPVLLKVRGVSMEKKQSLEELYPIAFGPLALRETTIKCGNLEQNEQKSESVMVANLSQKPINVTFSNVSEHLKVKVSPNPIPARSTAEMSFTVTASRDLWGKNSYMATPMVNGRSYAGTDGNNALTFNAFTKENYGNISDADKANGPMPKIKVSTYSAGRLKRGQTIHAEFTIVNEGKKPFEVYKVDADAKSWSYSAIPSIKPGEQATFKVNVNTTDMPDGEVLTIVTLTTNSPSRPIINLFVAGVID